MPNPDAALKDSADLLMFFSRLFLEHNRLKHITAEVDGE
jgi:hypothetical protein